MSFETISDSDLTTITGGLGRPVVRPIFEKGGIVGPKRSPTPRPFHPIFEDGGIVGPKGSPTPHPIPERGGIVGPKGSPTPF